MPDPVLQNLNRMLARGRLTTHDWAELWVAFRQQPARPSPAATALADALFVDAVTPAARPLIARFLNSRGYRLSASAPDGPAPLQPVVATTPLHTADLGFRRLLQRVGRSEASTTVVAMLDSGCDVDHNVLRGRFATNAGERPGNGVDDDHNGYVDDVVGYDFIVESGAPHPGVHGTVIGGIASQGLAQVRLLPVRVIDEVASRISGIGRGLDYAASRGARVVNLSMRTSREAEVDEGIAAMRRHPEIIFVIAAANDGERLGDPGFNDDRHSLAAAAAHLPNVIVVAAATEHLRRASFSNYGPDRVHVAAPGTRVFSTTPFDGYASVDGTSVSAPIVSRLAAQLALIAPALSPTEVREVLIASSNRIPGWERWVAAEGIINADRAQHLAAVIALVREGRSPDEAVDVLSLGPTERSTVLRLARTFSMASATPHA